MTAARLVFLILALSAALPVHGQRPGPESQPTRSRRFLAVANLALAGAWKPDYTAGGLMQISINKSRMKKGSVLFMIPGWLRESLVEGPLPPDITGALRRRFLRLEPSSALIRAGDAWSIRSGPDTYFIRPTGDSLAVSSIYGTEKVQLPSWFVHAMLTGGGHGIGDYAVSGQLGLLKRNVSTMFTAVGGAIQGTIPRQGLGPVLRIEVLDVLGMQLGPILLEDRDVGVYGSVDFMHGLWEDIGIR